MDGRVLMSSAPAGLWPPGTVEVVVVVGGGGVAHGVACCSAELTEIRNRLPVVRSRSKVSRVPLRSSGTSLLELETKATFVQSPFTTTPASEVWYTTQAPLPLMSGRDARAGVPLALRLTTLVVLAPRSR